MKYNIVLADIDNTLFDFNADSREALEKAFSTFSLPYSHETWEEYHAVNQALWKEYEEGKIEKKFIYPTRFARYLAQKGLSANAEELNACYMKHLEEGSNYFPQTKVFLETLRDMGVRVFGATNGSTSVQKARMARSGMAHLFEKVFISEEMGHQKPTKEYYNLIFAEIGEENRANAIMLGDSLSSDMQGGRNAGIATCYIGESDPHDDRCDYVIHELMEFPKILL